MRTQTDPPKAEAQPKLSRLEKFFRIAIAIACLATIHILSNPNPIDEYFTTSSSDPETYHFSKDILLLILWSISSISLYPISHKLVISINILLLWWSVHTHYGWIRLLNNILDTLYIWIWRPFYDVCEYIVTLAYDLVVYCDKMLRVWVINPLIDVAQFIYDECILPILLWINQVFFFFFFFSFSLNLLSFLFLLYGAHSQMRLELFFFDVSLSPRRLFVLRVGKHVPPFIFRRVPPLF